jgi:hypothetical protein
MKLMKYILALFTLVGVGALEVCAQTSSSASQTVTFGVHRSAPIVLASAQTSSVSVKEIGFERASPLKIAVGSDSRSDIVSEIRSSRFERSFAENKASFSAVKSFNLKSRPAEKTVFTLTE